TGETDDEGKQSDGETCACDHGTTPFARALKPRLRVLRRAPTRLCSNFNGASDWRMPRVKFKPRSTPQARVLFQPAAIHDDEQAGIERALCCRLVDHALLQPDRTSAHADRFINGRTRMIGTAKHVNQINLQR